jgi:SAM-dependent methyltransferase
VEPLPGMRAILERELPGLESHAGSAEAIPVADGTVDGVFCGQSAHWFAHDRAVGEIARVLRPGGVLVAAWNRPDETEPSPLPEAYLRRLAEIRPALPWDRTWADAVERGPFGAVQEAIVTHGHVNDREAVLRETASASWIASRDDREDVLRELAALLPAGTYRFPLETIVTWAVRA